MRKKLTASEVAGGTRMKVQVVTAIEEENFDIIAAPIYAKGFIRLYAEFVGLDATQLVAEYVERFIEAKSVSEPEPDVSHRPVPQSPQGDGESEAQAEPDPPPPAPVVEEPPPPAPAAPVPAPVADVVSPPDDRELDLFSEVEPASNDRRGILMDDGYREEAPSVHDRVTHALAGAVDALQHCGDTVNAACSRACKGGAGFFVSVWKRLMDTVVARRRELSHIDFKDLSARHMMALLGVLVLVLLVISSLSRCVRGKGEVEVSGDTPALSVAAEPSDVYLD